jgi:hypothetical protein
MPQVRSENHKRMEQRYEILGPNQYGRFLLYRQPDGWIVDAGTDFKPLFELMKDIEKRLRR